MFLRRLLPAWDNVLVIVKPQTVVAWHQAGFRLFWRLRSRAKRLGRPKIDAEVRVIIRRMVEENPTWGAPRVHGELLKLGFNLSERTVSRYLRRPSPPARARKLWTAFLRNHRDVLAARLLSMPSRCEGRYAIALYFAERYFGSLGSGRAGSRVFDIYCNGEALMRNFDIFKEAGEADRAVRKTFHGLRPNAQGKLMLTFVPVKNYACLNAIEVVDGSE